MAGAVMQLADAQMPSCVHCQAVRVEWPFFPKKIKIKIKIKKSKRDERVRGRCGGETPRDHNNELCLSRPGQVVVVLFLLFGFTICTAQPSEGEGRETQQRGWQGEVEGRRAGPGKKGTRAGRSNGKKPAQNCNRLAGEGQFG